MDPLLRSRRELVVQIFRLVDYPENLEVSVAAMHAIADMANSVAFAPANGHSPHKLYSILEAAGELPDVMESFIRRLEREETEHVSLLTDDQNLGQEDKKEFLTSFGLANMIRLQIVNFLIANIQKPGYNLAHFLLGFSTDLLKGILAMKIAAPGKDGEGYTCLHMVLELLAFGLGHPSTPIIALDHPSLGQKCYELIHEMLRNKVIAAALATYLREHEDFFRKQLVHFAHAPVDVTDVGFTILEFFQKAALLRGAALDLHLAFAEGLWSYARKLVTVLVKGSLDEGKKDESLDKMTSFLAVHLLSVQDLLNVEYISTIDAPLHDPLLQAMASFVCALYKISELILAGLDRIPYDRYPIFVLQQQLVTSIIPILCRLQNNRQVDSNFLDASSVFATALCGYICRTSQTATRSGSAHNANILAGDESIQLADAILSGIIRTESSLFARGYWYSAFCDCCALLGLESSNNSVASISHRIQVDGDHLVEIAASDSVTCMENAEGWKTIASTFLRLIITLNGARLTGHLLKIGFLKSLMVSLKSEDRSLSFRSENAIFLWRARFALLEKIAMDFENRGAERLVDAGVCDYISTLCIWENAHSVAQGQSWWNHFMYPLMRFLAVLASTKSVSVKNDLSNLILGQKEALLAFFKSHAATIECSSLMVVVIAETATRADFCRLFCPAIVKIISAICICADLNRTFSGDQKNDKLILLNYCLSFFIKTMLLTHDYSVIRLQSEDIHDESLPVDHLMTLLDHLLPTLHGSADSINFIVCEKALLLLTLSLNRLFSGSTVPVVNESATRGFKSQAAQTLGFLEEVINKNRSYENFDGWSRFCSFFSSLLKTLPN